MTIRIPIRRGLLLMLLAGVTEIPVVRVAADDNLPKIKAAGDLSLEELSDRAGIIFAGRVVSVELPQEDAADRCECVRITFQVDEGIRNATSGELIIVNEWAGLWHSSGGIRYRRGDRLLMFYYPPNSAGITSPVAGTAGRISVGSQDQIQLAPAQKSTILRSLRLREAQSRDSASGGDSLIRPNDKLSLGRLVRALRLIVSEAN